MYTPCFRVISLFNCYPDVIFLVFTHQQSAQSRWYGLNIESKQVGCNIALHSVIVVHVWKETAHSLSEDEHVLEQCDDCHADLL